MNMMMMFSIASLFYIVILIILFFSKGYLKNKETKIYSVVLVLLLFGIVLELSMRLVAPFKIQFIDDICSKLFLIYTCVWFSLITLYNFLISFNNEKKYNLFKKIIILFDIISAFIITILNIEYNYVEGLSYYTYTYGLAVNYLYKY